MLKSIEEQVNPAAVHRPIVVKIGGSTLGSGDTTLEDLVTLQCQGTPMMVVHGGGKVISQWMKRSGTLPRFVRGLRVTDEATLEVVVAVLTGLVNKQLVTKIQALGGRAVGLSGVDGGLLQCRIMDPELGFVGEVERVNPEPVRQVMQMDHIPVVAPVASGCQDDSTSDGTMLNVNGDSAAGALALALKAERLIFLTDVEGVLDSSRRLISRILPEQARALVTGGVAAGGMIPKLEACLLALPHVRITQIIDGRKSHALLECLSSQDIGTRVG